MTRIQVNVRLDAEIAKRIDEKRTQLQKELGRIPTRSDVMRMALDKYLGRDKSKRRDG